MSPHVPLYYTVHISHILIQDKLLVISICLLFLLDFKHDMVNSHQTPHIHVQGAEATQEMQI